MKVLRRTVAFGANPDLDAVLREAGFTSQQVGAVAEDGKITMSRASAAQMGGFLDALFGVGLGIRPFDGESDYAVGAEW